MSRKQISQIYTSGVGEKLCKLLTSIMLTFSLMFIAMTAAGVVSTQDQTPSQSQQIATLTSTLTTKLGEINETLETPSGSQAQVAESKVTTIEKQIETAENKQPKASASENVKDAWDKRYSDLEDQLLAAEQVVKDINIKKEMAADLEIIKGQIDLINSPSSTKTSVKKIEQLQNITERLSNVSSVLSKEKPGKSAIRLHILVTTLESEETAQTSRSEARVGLSTPDTDSATESLNVERLIGGINEKLNSMAADIKGDTDGQAKMDLLKQIVKQREDEILEEPVVADGIKDQNAVKENIRDLQQISGFLSSKKIGGRESPTPEVIKVMDQILKEVSLEEPIVYGEGGKAGFQRMLKMKEEQLQAIKDLPEYIKNPGEFVKLSAEKQKEFSTTLKSMRTEINEGTWVNPSTDSGSAEVSARIDKFLGFADKDTYDAEIVTQFEKKAPEVLLDMLSSANKTEYLKAQEEFNQEINEYVDGAKEPTTYAERVTSYNTIYTESVNDNRMFEKIADVVKAATTMDTNAVISDNPKAQSAIRTEINAIISKIIDIKKSDDDGSSKMGAYREETANANRLENVVKTISDFPEGKVKQSVLEKFLGSISDPTKVIGLFSYMVRLKDNGYKSVVANEKERAEAIRTLLGLKAGEDFLPTAKDAPKKLTTKQSTALDSLITAMNDRLKPMTTEELQTYQKANAKKFIDVLVKLNNPSKRLPLSSDSSLIALIKTATTAVGDDSAPDPARTVFTAAATTRTITADTYSTQGETTRFDVTTVRKTNPKGIGDGSDGTGTTSGVDTTGRQGRGDRDATPDPTRGDGAAGVDELEAK